MAHLRTHLSVMTGRWRRWLPDVGLVLGLALVAWLAAGAYATGDLFIWGDHPGQFMRFWYPLSTSLPRFGRVVDWNPLWYAGYPELQFYPPGYILLGLGLNFLTLGLLSPERVYSLIPSIALALPVFTAYAFLRRTLAPLGGPASRVAGIVAGLLALSFTPMWGGTNAVPIGMLGERLAFGLAPLVLLAGWRLVERPAGRRLAVASALLAAVALLHPFHAPALVLAVGLYATGRRLLMRVRRQTEAVAGPAGQGDRPEPAHPGRRAWLAGWLLLAGGLIAWWALPLLVRQSPYAASLVRASPAQTQDWLWFSPTPALLVAALPALTLLAHRDWRIQATTAALALLIPAIALGIWFDYAVLFQILGVTSLDPIRFIAEYYMAILLLTGAAAGALCTAYLWRAPLLAAALLVLFAVKLAPVAPVAWRDVHDRARIAPETTKSYLLGHPAFAGLWEALRDDPARDGRALFTSYYLQVAWDDGRMTPTAIKAMTPYFTGREIIGGTFSHWSPVARLLWVGDPWARLLPERVELEDDRSLFGIPWEQMTDAALVEAAQALAVTTIVVDADDVNARAMLDAAPHFRRFWDNGYFFLYHVEADPPSWIAAHAATAQLTQRSPRQWRVAVEEAQPGATLTVKMAPYPLWRAEVAGRPLTIHADRYAAQWVELPVGGPYTVTFSYREGWPEWAGLILTVLGLLAMAALLGGRPPIALQRTTKVGSSTASPPVASCARPPSLRL